MASSTTIVVLALISISVYHVLAEHVSMEKHIQECNKTHPIEKEKLFSEKATNASSLFKDSFKNDHNAQCLIKCIMNKFHVVDDKGNILASGLKNHLVEYEKSMKDYLKSTVKFNVSLVDVTQVEEFINKCKPKAILPEKLNPTPTLENLLTENFIYENEEPCLKAYKLLVCLANENDITVKANGTTTVPLNVTKSPLSGSTTLKS